MPRKQRPKTPSASAPQSSQKARADKRADKRVDKRVDKRIDKSIDKSVDKPVAKGADKEDLPPKAEGEKLQKVLARTGIGSRREMEKWIEARRVSINGKLATLGDRVGDKDRLSVDGRTLERAPAEATRCILYHKPTGEVTTRSDPEGRSTVFDRLPNLKSGRWISIGRLDFNTSGLLLFTTDGDLANSLMHPSSNIEREYMIRVMGEIKPDMLKRMIDGVMLEDGMARFTDIQEASGDGINRWYYVVIMEGRNREVRRLWESQGLTVSRLKRVRYGDVFIPSKVKQGQWVELERKEIKSLYRMADLPMKEPQRATAKEKDVMERQFGKRTGRGVAKKGPDKPPRKPSRRTSKKPSGR
jgi:23S rRNA pseudouridine2605 synthase